LGRFGASTVVNSCDCGNYQINFDAPYIFGFVPIAGIGALSPTASLFMSQYDKGGDKANYRKPWAIARNIILSSQGAERRKLRKLVSRPGMSIDPREWIGGEAPQIVIHQDSESVTSIEKRSSGSNPPPCSGYHRRLTFAKCFSFNE
jgi:hypothetical protein